MGESTALDPETKYVACLGDSSASLLHNLGNLHLAQMVEGLRMLRGQSTMVVVRQRSEEVLLLAEAD